MKFTSVVRERLVGLPSGAEGALIAVALCGEVRLPDGGLVFSERFRDALISQRMASACARSLRTSTGT